MGVAVSKVQCYTAFGGLDPSTCLPVCIDAGTDNEALLADRFYIGLRHKRVRGDAYDELVEEFVAAAQRRFGLGVLLQFEDFGNHNGARLLNSYRGQASCFNDDIQGTGAAALAGLIAALPLTAGDGRPRLGDHTYLVAGAGETGCAMGDLLACAIAAQKGVQISEARKCIWMVDPQGLVTRARAESADSLADHKLPWAHRGPSGCSELLSAVEALKPSVLIGVRRHRLSYASGSALGSAEKGGAKLFTRPVVEAMARFNQRPLIFALSRPVENSECTPEEAYAWSGGRALYVSGCLQPAVTLPDGSQRAPLNSTSAYIFPGVALGAVVSGAERLRDDAFLAAAQALAGRVTDEDRAKGALYPPFAAIRDISAHVAKAVAATTYDAGLATRKPRPRDLLAECRAWMWDPNYKLYARNG